MAHIPARMHARVRALRSPWNPGTHGLRCNAQSRPAILHHLVYVWFSGLQGWRGGKQGNEGERDLCICVCVCVCVCVCMYVCMYVCVYVCMYVFFMYVCMYVCTHARTHTHTHKHTNIQVNAKRQYVSVEWDSGDYAPLLYVGQKDLFQLAVFDDPFSSADNQGAGGGGGVGADGRGGEGGRAPVTPNYVPGVLSGGRQERGQANLYASQTTTLQAEMSETQPSPPPSVAVSRGGLLSLSLSLLSLSLSPLSLSFSLSVVFVRPCVYAA